MNVNDDHIVKARKARFIAHLPDTMDLALITLKGHLLIEEILDDIIALHCKAPGVVAETRIAFFVKSRLVQGLVGQSLPDDLWPMIDALRNLRNDLAHKLESQKLDKLVAKFIAITYPVTAKPKQDAPMADTLKEAIAFMYGYLAAHEYRLRANAGLPVEA